MFFNPRVSQDLPELYDMILHWRRIWKKE